MITKSVDSKGRITLGLDFANQTVVIDDSIPNQLIVRKMVLISTEEAWLYETPEAMQSLRKGLRQASQMQFSDFPPDIGSDDDDSKVASKK